MASIILGCDRNGINDQGWQNTVAKSLQKAGHDVTKLDIGPNSFAKYSYNKKAKGKIGIFLIAPAIFAIADCYSGNTYFKYAYFGIRGDCDRGLKNESDFKTKPIHRDSDCTSICNKLDGKNFPEINNIVKSKCQAVFGDTPENMANNLVQVIGGGSSGTSSESESYSSAKEALKEVLSGWDGDVECFVREDTVYVRKIRDPATAALQIIEGDNVINDSVSITDINPNCVNSLKVIYKDKTILLEDKILQKRFGKIKSSIKADGVTSLKEAKAFSRREWHKLHRDNGRVIELQVIGGTKWKAAQWARVYLPSFGVNDYMYISRVSQDDSGEWTCNLTLVDYPPSLGKPKKDSKTSNESNNADTSIETVVKEIGNFKYAKGCSNKKCLKKTGKGECWALSDYIHSRLTELGVTSRIVQYKTGYSSNHRQVQYKKDNKWVMFPYAKSGIDHLFYTNSIPSSAKEL